MPCMHGLATGNYQYNLTKPHEPSCRLPSGFHAISYVHGTISYTEICKVWRCMKDNDRNIPQYSVENNHGQQTIITRGSVSSENKCKSTAVFWCEIL